jgi:hypothetical protein
MVSNSYRMPTHWRWSTTAWQQTVINSLPTHNTQTVSTPFRLTTHRRYSLRTDCQHTDGDPLPTYWQHAVYLLRTDWQHTHGIHSLPADNTDGIHSLLTDNTQTVIHSLPADNKRTESTPNRLTTHKRYPIATDWQHTNCIYSVLTDNTQTVSTPYRLTKHRRYPFPTVWQHRRYPIPTDWQHTDGIHSLFKVCEQTTLLLINCYVCCFGGEVNLDKMQLCRRLHDIVLFIAEFKLSALFG